MMMPRGLCCRPAGVSSSRSRSSRSGGGGGRAATAQQSRHVARAAPPRHHQHQHHHLNLNHHLEAAPAAAQSRAGAADPLARVRAVAQHQLLAAAAADEGLAAAAADTARLLQLLQAEPVALSMDEPAAAAAAVAGHPVLALIARRLAAGPGPGGAGEPGARPDGAKLGLVVEGGGMRGIVTGAMLMALQDLKLDGVFDAVYGASAGAINATYFLSGQPRGLDIYTEYLATTGRFLSLRRYFSRGAAPAMDLDYLLDEVMVDEVPLNHQAVIDSRLPLKVVASSLSSLRCEVLDGFSCKDDLIESLKCSASVPLIATRAPRRHRGHDFCDAAVFEPLPVKAALRDGCTHVLALCSRPYRVRSAWGKYLERLLTGLVKSWLLNPDWCREAWRVEPLHSSVNGQPLDEHLLQLLLQGRALELDASALDGGDGSSGSDSDGSTSGASSGQLLLGGHVLPVYPGQAANFSPICLDVGTLNGGRAEGYRAVRALAPALLMQHAAAAAARGGGSLH